MKMEKGVMMMELKIEHLRKQFNINLGQLQVILVLSGLLSLLASISCTLFLSAKCKDSLSALMISFAVKHIFICWELLFYGDGCPGQFVVTLRIMISDILVSPISARQNQDNEPLSSPFSASDSSSQSSRFPHLRR